MCLTLSELLKNRHYPDMLIKILPLTVSLLKKVLWFKNMKWILIQEASFNLLVNANVFQIGYPTVLKKKSFI